MVSAQVLGEFFTIVTREKQFIEELMKRGPVPGGRTWRREDAYER